MKIVYLDGLRGLAALIVVVSHFFQVFAPSVFEGREEIEHFAFEGMAARTPFNLLFNGNFSVCLFFVLSGYVLSYRFFGTGDRSIVYSSAIRRYFRLAVPALASVFLAYLILVLDLGAYDNIRGMTLSSMPDPFAADANLLVMLKESLFHTFFTYGSQYNPVLWTMTYELFGSFMIFVFLIVCGRHRIRYAVYAILICLFIDSHYLGFVLGMLLSDVKNSGKERPAFIHRSWIQLLLLCAGIYLGSYPYVAPQGTVYSILQWGTADFDLFVFYHVIGSFLILTVLLHSSRMQSIFSHRFFAYLGKISFSLYLVHFTVICSFGSYVFLYLSPFLSYGPRVLFTTILTFAVIAAMAHWFYRLVDARILLGLSRWNRALFTSGKLRGQGHSEQIQTEQTIKAD
ncbi:MAG: acyltransferase [Paenibacillus lautus]|jgi:peptidoglycan/LPS O-acetylase OafA/YrhL|uniref:acyltransferase family protein n=1 Tax=Paenibacillus lautus TaxID=1401 RepID=UPI0026F314F1|nr:acyltransferase [Paenibacillus lautus]MCI1773539.1 acyltransferase [Paenibacillus lautus]